MLWLPPLSSNSQETCHPLPAPPAAVNHPQFLFCVIKSKDFLVTSKCSRVTEMWYIRTTCVCSPQTCGLAQSSVVSLFFLETVKVKKYSSVWRFMVKLRNHVWCLSTACDLATGLLGKKRIGNLFSHLSFGEESRSVICLRQ